MTETEHYKFKKPDGNEYVGPGPFNDNAETMDAALHALDEKTQDLDYIPTKEKGAALGVATLDKDGHVVEAQIPGGLADKAVTAHNESADPHANMNYVVFREGAPVPPVPVNADLLEGKTKAEVSAEILAAMDASLASDKVKWDAKADLVAPVTVTVPLAGWTGAGPWVQTVSVAGVTAADEHIGISLAVPVDRSTVDLIAKAYGCIVPPDGDVETVDGGIKLTCFKAKPEVAFQVVVKGVR